MPRGASFYTRSRTFTDEVYPPALEADTYNEYEAAHQEASNRVVAIESDLNARPTSDDIATLRVLTQAEFDALTPDPRTVYLILAP